LKRQVSVDHSMHSRCSADLGLIVVLYIAVAHHVSKSSAQESRVLTGIQEVDENQRITLLFLRPIARLVRQITRDTVEARYRAHRRL